MNNIINFTCPDFIYGKNIYEQINDLKLNFSSALTPNANVASIFGNVPNCIWNGGNYACQGTLSIEELKNYSEYYYNKKIPLKLTFTNPLIDEQLCEDYYANLIASIFENDLNQVMIASPTLEQHIRNNYPKYKINRSIIATEFDPKDAKFYEDLLNTYNEVVLPKRCLSDLVFLDTIKPELRPRFELLTNDPCPQTCPRLYQHYKDIANVQLCPSIENMEKSYCVLDTDNSFKTALKKPFLFQNDQISVKQIFDTYLPLGYNNFKIAGRNSLKSVAFAITQYMILPMYQLTFLALIM